MNTAATDREDLRARDVASSGAAIDVRDLRKRYGALEAVRGISFEVQRGEIFGLIGADGAGKTTTFQILAGVMEATGGTAEIFGKPARDARSQTGYLTQTFSLYPDLSVSGKHPLHRRIAACSSRGNRRARRPLFENV